MSAKGPKINWLTIATSLGLHKTNAIHMSTTLKICWRSVQYLLGYSAGNVIFCRLVEKGAVVILVIFGVTGPIFIKFAQVCRYCHWIFLSWSVDIAVSFETLLCRVNLMYPNFALKLVAMATSLRNRKKRSSSIICEQIPSIWCNNCENWSSGSWDNWSPRNHFKIKKRN